MILSYDRERHDHELHDPIWEKNSLEQCIFQVIHSYVLFIPLESVYYQTPEMDLYA